MLEMKFGEYEAERVAELLESAPLSFTDTISYIKEMLDEDLNEIIA